MHVSVSPSYQAIWYLCVASSGLAPNSRC